MGADMVCENVAVCPFFIKHKDENDQLYQLMIRYFCRGELAVSCKRKEHEATKGETAPEHLCPSGSY
jgi:hypothetical protein